jgi:hypothetical protein
LAAAVDQVVHENVTLKTNSAEVYGGAVSLQSIFPFIFLLWYLAIGFARVDLIGHGKAIECWRCTTT